MDSQTFLFELLKLKAFPKERFGNHVAIQINLYKPRPHTTGQRLPILSFWKSQKASLSLSKRILSHVRLSLPPQSFFARQFSWIFRVGLGVSVVLSGFLVAPDLYYRVVPYEAQSVEAAVDSSVLAGKFSEGTLYSPVVLPVKDPNLPTGNWLVIPKIGVRTEILESEDPEESLRKGVWRVTDFATPVDGKEYPTILAAHKFGYLKWSNQYRRQNSFYNLEKLEVGDTFEVLWDQRRFTFEVYAGEEGKEISDYQADVILYTCKYLNSPVRFFRYARRVEY